MKHYPLQNHSNPAIRLRQRAARLLQMAALAMVLPVAAQAQAPTYSVPSWWWGVAGGANVNYYGGTTSNLTDDVQTPTPFHNGNGLGLYVAPVVAYLPAASHWGGMLELGYDNRSGKFEQETAPCNCPSNLSVKLDYVSIEPSVRFAPMRKGLYFYLGPRLAYNVRKSFLLTQVADPGDPSGAEYADKLGDLENVRPVIISGQVGAGYDFHINRGQRRNQWMVSPFVAYHPYLGQDPRTSSNWTVSTLRAGVALKWGRGKLLPVERMSEVAPRPEAVIPPVTFTAYAPGQIPDTRMVNEIFPLRNYVFFDSGSTKIPARYVHLRQSQAKDFKEDRIGMPLSASYLGRSHRQLVVYYNVLNILGDRMTSQPSTQIRLIGISEESMEDGLAMATAIQEYLMQVFGISANRIAVQGRQQDLDASLAADPQKLALQRASRRRVSIESDSPGLLMEYQQGPSALMRPIELRDVEAPPLESYVNFNNEGSDRAFTSWRMEISDANGRMQYYGPYTRERVSLPGKTILGRNAAGRYHVVMIGETPSNQIVRKTADVQLALLTPVVDEEVMRFSVIYEFDESKTSDMYIQYLNEVVVSKIPAGSMVMIHGYTDITGDEAYNRELSIERAEDVRNVLEKGLAKVGRKNVRLEAFGFGEDPFMSQFANDYPEERCYNRSVVIDIVIGQ